MSNELIYAISSLGEVKLEEFYILLDSVSIGGIPDEDSYGLDFRQHIIRLLDSLGYCEFDFKRRKVFMCPPGLARLPSTGLPKAVLVGARIPGLISRLKKEVKSEYDNAIFLNIPQKQFAIDIPPLICIEADSIDTLKNIAEKCGIIHDLEAPASWKLASMSADIGAIKHGLNFISRSWSAQPLKVFDATKLRFTSFSERSDRCLTDFLNPVDKQHVHWLWDNSTAAEIDRDWGRYVTLNATGRNVLLYDKASLQMAVPTWVPLPTLLARSLAMCTGLPPDNARTGENGAADIPPNHPLQVYSGVSEPLAYLVSSKVGQNLRYHDLRIDSGGELGR